MQIDWKKIGVMMLIIIAVLLLGFFIYWFFWRTILGPISVGPTATTTAGLPGAGAGGTRTTTTGPGGLPISGGQPVTGTPGITPTPVVGAVEAKAFVNVPAYFSSMTTNGSIVYYNARDGKFYRVDANGNIIALSDQTFYNVSNTVFDHAGERAVLQYPDGSNIIFDFKTNKQITLPKHWQDFGFSPTDQEITFKNIGLDVENRFLVTAKYDGSNAKIIESIGENADKVTPNWSPNNQVVATYVESADANRTNVYFIGQNNENFKSLIVEGRDFRGLWSPSGSQMMYSVYDSTNDYKPQLWISDATGDNIGGNRQKINIQTWADRCTFAGDGVAICSVPETMPYGAGLDPANTTAGITDQIWAVNLQTGQTALVANPTNISSINKIMFSASSPNNVYLSDGTTNKIYQLDLNTK